MCYVVVLRKVAFLSFLDFPYFMHADQPLTALCGCIHKPYVVANTCLCVMCYTVLKYLQPCIQLLTPGSHSKSRTTVTAARQLLNAAHHPHQMVNGLNGEWHMNLCTPMQGGLVAKSCRTAQVLCVCAAKQQPLLSPCPLWWQVRRHGCCCCMLPCVQQTACVLIVCQAWSA